MRRLRRRIRNRELEMSGRANVFSSTLHGYGEDNVQLSGVIRS